MNAASTIGGGPVGGGQSTIAGGRNNYATDPLRALPWRLAFIRSARLGVTYGCRCGMRFRTWRGFMRHTCR